MFGVFSCLAVGVSPSASSLRSFNVRPGHCTLPASAAAAAAAAAADEFLWRAAAAAVTAQRRRQQQQTAFSPVKKPTQNQRFMKQVATAEAAATDLLFIAAPN